MDAGQASENAQDDIMNLDGGYLDDYEVRKSLYWALFAGAARHLWLLADLVDVAPWAAAHAFPASVG